jgi:hypothetical protein
LRARGENPVERAAVEILHHHVWTTVVLAHFVNLDDIRVLQAGQRLRFDVKAGQQVRAGVDAGADHLESDDTGEALLPGLVDDAHAPVTQLAEDFVFGRTAMGTAPG